MRKHFVGFRLEPHLYHALKTQARQRGNTVSEEIRLAIREYLKKRSKKTRSKRWLS